MLRIQLMETRAQEEEILKQRSKIMWLKEGDRNSKFFHHRLQQRKKRNLIESIIDTSGMVYTGAEDISSCFKNYFVDLFSGSFVPIPDSFLLSPCKKVSKDMNSRLCRSCSSKEVWEALNNIDQNKAPGPDGYTSGFYQKHWEWIGPDIVKVIDHLLIFGELHSGVNHTLISLFPKGDNPILVTQYRPISVYVMCFTKFLQNCWRIN